MHLPTLGQCIDAVELAGLTIATRFGQPHQIEHKADTTPVTATDIEVNNILAGYAKLWEIGFIGEEGNGDEVSDYYLYVDPLDGTGAYIRGMATSTIAASIMHLGRPILAVIHNPITRQTWAAALGEGAQYSYQCGVLQPTFVAQKPAPRWRTAICSWPGVDQPYADYRKLVIDHPKFDDQQMGAFALAGGLIALGSLHATSITAKTAEEAAAMSLIVREAGGVAIDLHGNSLEYFEFGEYKGKVDFPLPRGAIMACDMEVASLLASLYS